jgi:hypothetical protein
MARKVSHRPQPSGDFHRYRRLPVIDRFGASREIAARVSHTSLARFAPTSNVTCGKKLAILPRWRGGEGGQIAAVSWFWHNLMRRMVLYASLLDRVPKTATIRL